MTESDDNLLAAHGWMVECKSPFEIRHEDGAFATLQAADLVLRSLREESIVMKFPDLALGARFRYLGKSQQVWIKISDDENGLVAEYDSNYIQHPRWTGQRICCFADSPTDVKELDVILVEE